MRLEGMCILQQQYIFQLSTLICTGNKFDHREAIISQQCREMGSVSAITLSGHLEATACHTDQPADNSISSSVESKRDLHVNTHRFSSRGEEGECQKNEAWEDRLC